MLGGRQLIGIGTTLLVLSAAACSSSGNSDANGGTPASTTSSGVASDQMDLTLAGGVEAKIRIGDPNDAIDQDIACYPPDSQTKSLNCDFGGLYLGGVTDASLAVDGYHGPGSYPIADNLDLSLEQADIVCSGTGGTADIKELPAQGTSNELDARVEFDAQLECTTPGGTENATLTGYFESHPCLAAGIDGQEVTTTTDAASSTTPGSILPTHPCGN